MKKRRINAKLAYATLGLAGVGIACTVLPMLPFTSSVSQSDIANAVRAGVSKPQAPNAASLKNLDAAGEKVMGAAAWRETSFVGNVRYSFKLGFITGANNITVAKPCGKTAEESGGTTDGFTSNPGNPGGGSGGGGGGGGGGIGGWLPGGCYGNCGDGDHYGEVGGIEQA